MNIRPDAWRRAFASPQVILSLLALVLAIVAVFLTRPRPIEAEPFELPAVEVADLAEEEVRLITFDRFNLEVPLRKTLELPEDASGRVAVIVEAVRDQLRGENGAWPAELPSPVVFVAELDGQDTAVLNFPVSQESVQLGADGFSRLSRSLEATLAGEGLERVVLLLDGQPPRFEAGEAEDAEAVD